MKQYWCPSQFTVPVGPHDKCTILIFLIARHGGDRVLLDPTPAVYVAIQEKVEILLKSHASNKEAMSEKAAEVS
jgi:hypothetical protein